MVNSLMLVRSFGMIHCLSQVNVVVACWCALYDVADRPWEGGTSNFWAAEPDGTQSTLKEQESL